MPQAPYILACTRFLSILNNTESSAAAAVTGTSKIKKRMSALPSFLVPCSPNERILEESFAQSHIWLWRWNFQPTLWSIFAQTLWEQGWEFYFEIQWSHKESTKFIPSKYIWGVFRLCLSTGDLLVWEELFSSDLRMNFVPHSIQIHFSWKEFLDFPLYLPVSQINECFQEKKMLHISQEAVFLHSSFPLSLHLLAAVLNPSSI